MGLKDALNALFGRTTLPRADLDSLFAVSTAAVTMQTSLGLKPSGRAGICFKPIESSRHDAAVSEIEDLLGFASAETGSEYRIETDEYGFIWVVLEDPDFDDLITGVHLVAQTLIEHAFGTYLLCAVYRFENSKPVYWIYSFKAGRYYPFVPEGQMKRDNGYEFRLRSLLERELPLEKDVEKWYPLWGLPL
ncbi:PspA-associated protein PspAB [Methanofollis fontis]|uniref:Uncharacterized protein n=1 Tax=Methanofollis fontis TaxID=2052832 RepID=A0A483CVA6_9EURY|nr:hypothetical protein [Methanofollis fontis]TAJ43265.1 hypothetical protein CUJ86_11525 [Methanofollis fontis]